jgi:hypothetical protein
MDSLLANPVFQSAVAPLLVSLGLAMALWRAEARWQGLAIAGGFLAALWLITGLSVTPLTSTRKIVLASLVLPLLALTLELLAALKPKLRLAILAVLADTVLIWVLWPVLRRMEWGPAVLETAALGLYVAWLIVATGLLAARTERLGSAALALAIGTGGSAFIAASALYAQLGFALAAATGGLLLRWLIWPNQVGLGLAAAMAAAVPLALLGAAGTVYTQLPWTVLCCLALIPLAALIPVMGGGSRWLRVPLMTVIALLPALPALWLAWRAAGDVIY